MAEDRYPLEEEIRAGMARWQVGAEAQIEALAHEQQSRIVQEHRLFLRADDGILSFDDALTALREHNNDREWARDYAAWQQSPQGQRSAAEDRAADEAIARMESAEYQGDLAEQRFYQEQDPGSEWYREDLYHGEPGPDVAIDLAEAYARELAESREPMSAADVDSWDEEEHEPEYGVQVRHDMGNSVECSQYTRPLEAIQATRIGL
jgi:hypothetical protein